MGKKRQQQQQQHERDAATQSFIATHHPEKPSAVARPTPGRGRHDTVSVAIPASIVVNAQTQELRAWLAGSIARTCAIFGVTEIVVYQDSSPSSTSNGDHQHYNRPRGKYRDPQSSSESIQNNQDDDNPASFLARILEYLETPQYLRKALFPLHPSLRLAGLLPPLDCPHHLRRDDQAPFREGVTVAGTSSSHNGGEGEPMKKKKKRESEGIVVWVDVGLWDPVQVTLDEGMASPPINTRVTVRMPSTDSDSKGRLVSPTTPTVESGLYWGYQVRRATSLAHVLSESPFKHEGGYDLSIGTSERGTPIEHLVETLPPFRHLLLTFGPLAGLELTIANDDLIPLGADDAGDLFDHWVNVVQGQGSRTVRTEEALAIALARLRTYTERSNNSVATT